MNQLKTAFWMVAMTVLLVLVGRLVANALGDGSGLT
jgi:hypothetical protein